MEGLKTPSDKENIVNKAPTVPIMDMLSKIHLTLRRYENIMISISGGSDSAIMTDAILRIIVYYPDIKATFVFFNTGLEYDATKRHLKELEEKYGIKIEWVPPVLPIPTCCKKYGLPFWSKAVSENIYRLQKHNFKWEDKPFDVLIQEHPRCRSALKWWCNKHPKKKNGKESALNIAYAPYLKEYIIAHPPPFRVSAKCCEKAKKLPSAKYEAQHDFDLVCTGVRKLEKGARAIVHKNCYTINTDKTDTFRPVFWLSDEDKQDYKKHYKLRYSDCYEIWGMKRTGCCGCPFGKEFEQELELMKKYEPKLYRAAMKIFGPSYEYTRGYYLFRENMKMLNKKGASK